MTGTATKIHELFRDEGVGSGLRILGRLASVKIESQWLKYRYRREYGAIAPRPDERLWVDPAQLDYTISSRDLYRDDGAYPEFGVLAGSWDRRKTHWRESVVWNGLRERFEEEKVWVETTYYEYSVDRLDAGKEIAYLDAPDTKENLREYLTVLDELYEDIATNGYDPSSVITAHIGRDGEWIVGHGNHRRTLARIAGVDAVPVRVKYRHEEWQHRRRRFHEAESVDELRDAGEFLSHPDIPA